MSIRKQIATIAAVALTATATTDLDAYPIAYAAEVGEKAGAQVYAAPPEAKAKEWSAAAQGLWYMYDEAYGALKGIRNELELKKALENRISDWKEECRAFDGKYGGYIYVVAGTDEQKAFTMDNLAEDRKNFPGADIYVLNLDPDGSYAKTFGDGAVSERVCRMLNEAYGLMDKGEELSAGFEPIIVRIDKGFAVIVEVSDVAAECMKGFSGDGAAKVANDAVQRVLAMAEFEISVWGEKSKALSETREEAAKQLQFDMAKYKNAKNAKNKVELRNSLIRMQSTVEDAYNLAIEACDAKAPKNILDILVKDAQNSKVTYDSTIALLGSDPHKISGMGTAETFKAKINNLVKKLADAYKKAIKAVTPAIGQ